MHQRESRAGARRLEAQRARLDALALSLYRAVVHGEVPHRYRAHLAMSARTALHRAVVMLVALLRAIERPLSRMAHRIPTAHPVSRQPSPFLKHMSEAGDTPPRIL